MYRPILATIVRGANISRRIRVRRPVAFPSLLVWLILSGLALGAAAGRAQAQSEVDEYRVKAGFLYHFAQLVDWPAGPMTDASQPLVLCTIGDDPFDGELDRSLGGRSAGIHTIRVRHLRDVKSLRFCQLLFISKSEDKSIPAIIAELGTAPVLTVGESDDFAQQGGMIRFSIEDSKVRFSINLEFAERAGLKISSKLLLVAKEVIGNRGGK